MPTAEKARASYGGVEWYENSERGVEHGLTLAAPTSDVNQPLVMTFPVKTELKGAAGIDNQLNFTDAQGQRQLRYAQLYVNDARGRRVPTALSWQEKSRSITWTIAHQGYEYPLTVDPLITRGAGTVTDADDSLTVDEAFGVSVSVSGNVMAVGAPSAGTSAAGAVVLYTRANAQGPWTQLKRLAATDGTANAFFGFSVSLSGDTLTVGAYGASGERGTVYLFAKDQGGLNQWGQTKRLTASNGSVGDQFGRSVSIFAESRRP